MGGKWRAFKREREGNFGTNQKVTHHPSMCGPRVAHVGREVCWTCGTRGLQAWPLAMLAPLALRSRSLAVFGHPNSEFESIFGL